MQVSLQVWCVWYLWVGYLLQPLPLQRDVLLLLLQQVLLLLQLLRLPADGALLFSQLLLKVSQLLFGENGLLVDGLQGETVSFSRSAEAKQDRPGSTSPPTPRSPRTCRSSPTA